MRILTRVYTQKHCLLVFLLVASFNSFAKEIKMQHHFVENVGQFDDLNGKKVLYRAVLGNYMAHFTKDGFIYEWADVTPKKKVNGEKRKGSVKRRFMEVSFEGAELQGSTLLNPSKTLYKHYIPQLNQTLSAIGHNTLVYENIYPLIDIVFTIPENGGLKYDLRLNPGANINDISIRYGNADEIIISTENEVQIRKDAKAFKSSIPAAYTLDSKDNLTVSFVLNKGIVSFHCEDYNAEAGMIIDPWETTPGGGVQGLIDGGFDNNDNIYCVGTVFPGTYNVHKFSADGIEEWITDISALGTGFNPDIAVKESTGDSYVFSGDPDGASDIFKLDASGLVVADYGLGGAAAPGEVWRCVYDQCNDSLILGIGGIVGGQVATIDQDLAGPLVIKELSGGSCVDVCAMQIDKNGENLHLLFPSTGTICGTGPEDFNNEGVKLSLTDLTTTTWNSDSELNILESICGTYNFGLNSGGINGIAVGNEFVYYYNGKKVVQKEEATGDYVGEIVLPATTAFPYIIFGYPEFAGDSAYGSFGIAADFCDNLYVGTDSILRIYDSGLDLLETVILPGTCIEVLYNGQKNVIYAMGANFIEEIDVSPYATIFELTATPDCGDCSAGTVVVESVADCIDPLDFVYSWMPGDYTTMEVTDLCPELYTLYVTYGCDTIFTDTISVLEDECGIEINIENDTICEGDCATLAADISGGGAPYTIDWGDGVPITDITQEVCPDITTEYEVIVFDALGASDTTIVTVFVDALPLVNLGTDTLLCPDETIVLDAENPGATYLWQDGSTDQTYTVDTDGIYTVEVQNGLCLVTDEIIVSYFEVELDLGPDTSLCIVTGIVLDPEGTGFTYEWQDGSVEETYTVTDTGTYHVTLFDIASGCIVSDTIKISAGTIPLNLGADTVICSSNTLILDAGTIPDVYEWSDGSDLQFLEVSENGDYWVNVSKGICTGTDTINIIFQELTAQFQSSDTIFCEQQIVDFTDLSVPDALITGWEWNFGDGETSNEQNPVHSYFSSGEYTVSLVVSSEEGCFSDSSRTVTITIFESPTADFSMTPNPAEVDEEVTFINLSELATSWYWEFGDGVTSTEYEPTHTYSTENNYTITLSVSNEYCEDEISKTLFVDEPLIFYVPNAFTPDGDDFNQTFSPVFTSGFDPYDYHLTIYNRWGEMLFESYDASVGWNGEYGNKGLIQDGVYIWKIEFSDSFFDQRFTYTGHVSVLK